MRSRSSANYPHEIIRFLLHAMRSDNRSDYHSKRMILDSIWQPFTGLKKQGKNQQDQPLPDCLHRLYGLTACHCRIVWTLTAHHNACASHVADWLRDNRLALIDWRSARIASNFNALASADSPLPLLIARDPLYSPMLQFLAMFTAGSWFLMIRKKCWYIREVEKMKKLKRGKKQGPI